MRAAFEKMLSIIEFPSLKRTRRYGAKVKTGCITCKIRHVRCDEGKPACARCTSTGRKCDGYAQDKAAQSKAITMRQGPFLGYHIPMLSSFGDAIHHLEFYHHCARRTLSSTFDKEFWSRTVLQMAQSESSIRHALIALGYLYEKEPGDLKHARASFGADDRRGTLFFHYNKAVGSLVDRMAEPSYAPEVGLVACLLFICIEFLRGNYHTAFTHLSSGLKIISEWQQKRLDSPVAIARIDDSKPTVEIEYPLVVPGNSSRPNRMIEDNILPLFLRTTTAALLYGVFVDHIIEIPIPPKIEHPFTSIAEAEYYSQELRNSSVLVARNFGQNLFERRPITTEVIHARAKIIEYHHAWFHALAVLERERDFSKDEQVLASTLKILYYATYISVACAVEIRQTAYDAHLESFKAINHHAKLILDSTTLPPSPSSPPNSTQNSPSPPAGGMIATSSPQHSPRTAANFTFEISLIPCLWFAAARCRCPVTRRESVALLARNPPREALWDAEQHGAVAKRIIEIEERAVDPETGWPVEATRLLPAVIDGNMDRNGGFWITFAFADWVRSKDRPTDRKWRREDAQWEEWFVL